MVVEIDHDDDGGVTESELKSKIFYLNYILLLFFFFFFLFFFRVGGRAVGDESRPCCLRIERRWY